MTNRPLTAAWLPALLLPLLAGCTVDQYARRIVKQDTTYGRIREAIVGTSEQLVKAGQVSWARRFSMPDGVEIDVWGLRSPTRPARGTVLVLHGLCDSKVTYLRLARMLTEKGFDVVLLDLRAHGRSTGKYVTYGALERADTKRVMDALLEEKAVAEPVYAFGEGLGGSVAILYAADEPRVKGLIAVAASRDIRAMARRFTGVPVDDRTFEKTIVRAGQIGGFDPDDTSAIKAIAKVTCPILLIHGKLDVFIPYTESQALHAAAGGPKELQLLSCARHVGIILNREAEIIKEVERVATGKLITTETPAPTE
ncbi:MAG: alpha/beta hydrolase [Planctomycetota bacterium]